MTSYIEIEDKFGKRRRARPGDKLADGERMIVPSVFMDAAARETRDVLAQKYGWRDSQPRGFVRGYAFADTTPPRNLRDEADKAYAEKCARLQHRRVADDDATVTHDAASARAIADRAWLDKKARLENAWRNRDGA
jgi:hypothetical protein